MTRKKRVEDEEKYYKIVKEELERLFKEKGVRIYLEITARGTFSNKLKSGIPSGREIIFPFLKKAAPDMTGFVEGCRLPGFVVAEVKRSKVELDDIYQVKKYADLFDTRFTFLISLETIPEEIKRLSKAIPAFLMRPTIYEAFVLTRFDEHEGKFVEWFEKNPFAESIYWK